MGVGALEHSWSQVRRLAERFPGEWDGEDLLGEEPLRVFVGARAPRRVLVVTKEALLRRWDRSQWPPGLAVIVASGMPTRAQAGVITALTSEASAPIPFVGDADPMDLHTFLSLRTHLGAQRLRFCGVSDALLELMGDDDVQPERLSTLWLSRFERGHLRIVETLANPGRFLGPRVSALLRDGKKIEVELLGFRAGLIPAMFEAALELAATSGRATRGI